MRLVRGSILSSKPCSASQAARILRRFLSSDEGTDISVTSFMNRAARSLESMSEGGHSTEKKKRGLDSQTSQMFENPKNPQNPRNPNEGISGLGHRDESSGGKHRRKRDISNAECLTTEKNEVGANEETLTEESSKLAKKLRAKHVLEGGESEVDCGLFTTPLIEKSEKSRRDNGSASTSMEIEEVETEKRKKERKHEYKENHDIGEKIEKSEKSRRENGSLSTSMKIEEVDTERKKGRKHEYEENHDHDGIGEKIDLGVWETPSTHKKKSKRARSNDEGTLDEDGDLVYSTSKRLEQGKHHVDEIKEVDQKRHSKKRLLESEDEVFADGQELHSIKKKRKDKTPK